MTEQLAVIWDLDGVLVDTAPFHFYAWWTLCQEHGIRLTEDDFKRTFGMRNPEIIATIFGKGVPEADMERMAERKEELFRDAIRGKVKPLPGAMELAGALGQSGYRQAIASSAPRQNIELILEALGKRNLFEAIVSAEDVRAGKPDPEIFLVAAERLGLHAETCVVIEDAIAGVQAAKAAHMRCIGVANTHPPERLADADLVVASMEEVSVGDVDALLET
ncbi:MAG: HAD family phosphatase [Chloroflexi bacterium]|nr:HAD family phosphatase [Chloroflexota bacterium]